MSIVKDQNLAPAGRRKINWVRDFMPALGGIEARFEQEQPFAGLRVAVSVHLEAKTANLGYVLAKGGAEVRLTGSNPLSTQDDVAAGLADMGVETFGIHGAMGEEYENLLIETLKFKPHLIVDDGGDLIHLLGGKCADLGEHLIGGCEETTTGILRLKAREREGILPCPMIAVNDAKAKHYYDNKYGTGQSVWDAIMHTANLVVAGKTVVVAAGLADMGVETFGIHGAMGEEYENLLIETLKFKPHLIVDDGGDLIHLLGGKCADLGEHLIGGCEETTTGILRLKAREREGILPCPMIAVNDAKAKHYYDNKYGTGQSVWDAIMHTANLVVAGKTVVVAGYGWCGKGVAMRAAGMGASVIVTEVDPFKALDATMNGFRVMPMDEAARYGDIFVTVTGCKDVITPKHFAVMKHNAILTNAGHFDCEVDVAGLAAMAVKRELRRDNIEGFTLPDGRVLNVIGEGRLVNLAAGNGHPAEIMDMSFSVQALALEWLVKHRDGLEKKVYQVPAEIDDAIGRVKLAAMGLSIDALTPEQEEYLNGWKA